MTNTTRGAYGRQIMAIATNLPTTNHPVRAGTKINRRCAGLRWSGEHFSANLLCSHRHFKGHGLTYIIQRYTSFVGCWQRFMRNVTL